MPSTEQQDDSPVPMPDRSLRLILVREERRYQPSDPATQPSDPTRPDRWHFAQRDPTNLTRPNPTLPTSPNLTDKPDQSDLTRELFERELPDLGVNPRERTLKKIASSSNPASDLNPPRSIQRILNSTARLSDRQFSKHWQ